MKSQPVIFLDRDGTIIEDQHYPREPEKVVLVPGAVEGLTRLRQKGYLLVVVSNQSGVGRGIIQDHEFKAVHEKCCELLRAHGVEIAEFAYCFHKPEDNCKCRKPSAGLLSARIGDVAVDFKKSFTIGDRDCDVHLAEGVGATGCLVLTGKGQATYSALSEDERQAIPIYRDLVQFAEQVPSPVSLETNPS